MSMTETSFKLEDSPVSIVNSIDKGQHVFLILEMNNKGLIYFSTKQIYKLNFVFMFIGVV